MSEPVQRNPDQVLTSVLEDLANTGELPVSRLTLVRVLREQLDLDLLTAKQAVDDYCARLPEGDRRVLDYPRARLGWKSLLRLGLFVLLAVPILVGIAALPSWARTLFAVTLVTLSVCAWIARQWRRWRGRGRALAARRVSDHGAGPG